MNDEEMTAHGRALHRILVHALNVYCDEHHLLDFACRTKITTGALTCLTFSVINHSAAVVGNEKMNEIFCSYITTLIRIYDESRDELKEMNREEKENV